MESIKSMVGRMIAVGAIIAVTAVFSGCEKEETVPARTVLVYLGVDNGFRDEAQQKIEQLTSAWNRNTDGNLLIYADTGEKAVLVRVYAGKHGNATDIIETYPSENSADPATLGRMLNRVRKYWPAASYGLLVLSHGTGWLPAEMSYPTPALKSVILDGGVTGGGNYMELADFAEAIPFPLDFIIFDVCFMGSVEVCYELRDKAAYIVASPAEVLVPGFVYETMMQRLFMSEPDLTAVAREFYEFYDRQYGESRSATVSVVKTSELEPLAAAVGDAIRQNPLPADIGNIQTFGYGRSKIYFDLLDYMQKLLPGNSSVQTALDRCVTYRAHTPSYYSMGTGNLQEIGAFGGLSTYIPQAAYEAANKKYAELKWAKRIGFSTLAAKE
jgi:hypothetical protein